MGEKISGQSGESNADDPGDGDIFPIIDGVVLATVVLATVSGIDTTADLQLQQAPILL